MRLDLYLCKQLGGKTRAAWQRAIKNGLVKINSKIVKKPHVHITDKVKMEIAEDPPIKAESADSSFIGSVFPFKIIFEDHELLALDKPSGIATHPPDKKKTVTELLSASREGFLKPLHRLDKDTSGVLLFAKSEKTHAALSDQWKARAVSKTYVALVKGMFETKHGLIEAPLHRSLKDRKKMAVSSRADSREAFTHFEVVKTFQVPSGPMVTLLDVFPKTGRTHQIRVHFAAIGHPVIGDFVYGDIKLNKKFEQKYTLRRQFLHATELQVTHPKTKKRVTFTSKLPADLKQVILSLSRGMTKLKALKS